VVWMHAALSGDGEGDVESRAAALARVAVLRKREDEGRQGEERGEGWVGEGGEGKGVPVNALPSRNSLVGAQAPCCGKHEERGLGGGRGGVRYLLQSNAGCLSRDLKEFRMMHARAVNTHKPAHTHIHTHTHTHRR
jgi:hypothetical protein